MPRDSRGLVNHFSTLAASMTHMEAVIDDSRAAAVIAQVAAGDEVAFARLVAGHHDDMARVAFVICGDPDLAQEAVQAAWPKIWQKVGTVRDPARLKAWLVSVAANEARQLARRRGRRQVREVAVDGAPDTAASAARADPAERAAEIDLANALAALDPTDRAVLALRYVAGFSSAEIGSAMGLSAGGVRARTARLLNRLRRELQP
ncbi:MAG TPA: RNA polymerase sigma factor [Candidatus Limnocylindrales bacterium]|jgi:RNA polymerase sigma-70 factor (ECF subfamily)